MEFANTDKEITIIHNSNEETGKKIIAYANTEELPIHEIDLAHGHLSDTHWVEIAKRMGISINELVNKDDSDFMRKYDDLDDLEDHDWLKMIRNNPDILRAPIVMKGERVVFMSNPQDMLHFLD